MSLLTLFATLDAGVYGAGEGDGIMATKLPNGIVTVHNANGLSQSFVNNIPQYVDPSMRNGVAAAIDTAGGVPVAVNNV